MSVSVIIPVYQAERFVRKAVQSACEQEEVSEVILIEDASTDNSLEVCENLVQVYMPLVELFRHDDGLNHGAGASRNLGIRKAKGKYIAFLDADDYYLPDRFKHDIEILELNSSVDGVYSALGVDIYDDDERERISFKLTTVTYPIPPDKLFENMGPIGASGYFSGDTLTVRRDVFDKVGYFNENLELTQDTHMWIKMAAKTSIVAGVIDKPVAIRGIHSGNRTKNNTKLIQIRPLLFLSLIKWAKINKLPLYRRALLWDCLYVATCNSLNLKTISPISKRIRIYSFLLKHGITKPYLFFHKQYYYSFITGMFLKRYT